MLAIAIELRRVGRRARHLVLVQCGEQTRISRLCRVQALKCKVELFAVVRVEAEVAEVHRRVAPALKVGDRVGVAERLAHLAVVDQHELAVHPIVDRLLADERLALRDLVLVMDGNVIDAARVNVEHVAQILAAHRRALDVPARIPLAPRAVPLHDVVGLRLFPKREVGRVTLLRIDLDARAGLLLVQIEPRQLAVFGELADVEIDAVVDLVCIALFEQRLDIFDHVGDVVGRLGDDLGLADVELGKVVKKDLGVVFRDLVRRLLLLARSLLHLVLALVAVRHQVPDIRDVHHAFELVAVIFERAAEDVHEDVGAQVADVRIVVDRRSAAVHRDLLVRKGDKVLLASVHSVVDPEHISFLSILLFGARVRKTLFRVLAAAVAERLLELFYPRAQLVYLVAHGVGQTLLVEVFDLFALQPDHPARHAHDRAVRRHVFEHHAAGAYLAVVPYRDRAQHLCARADHHVVLDRRMALARLLAGAAQRHALVDDDVGADLGRLADHHTDAVVDEHSAGDVRRRVNVHARLAPRARRDQLREPLAAVRVEPMREAVAVQRLEAAVRPKHLPLAARRRVVAHRRVEIHGYLSHFASRPFA